MTRNFRRRGFITTLMGLPALSAIDMKPFDHYPIAGRGLKPSLNAFSFNAVLLNGTMSLDDLFEYAAAAGFEAVDLTGYYLKGYPNVPTDEYIFSVKRK